MVKIAPSILSADFSRLGEDILSVSSAEYLHFDVMDGIFVPNISIGIPVLASVRKFTDMTLDVHLMITEPETVRTSSPSTSSPTLRSASPTRSKRSGTAAKRSASP